MLAVAAVLALGAIVLIVDVIGSPPPPAEFQYGPFSDLDILVGTGALIVVFSGVGWWAPPEDPNSDSLGSAGSVAAMLLAVVAPVVTMVGILAVFAEYAASKGNPTPAPSKTRPQ